MSYGSIYLKTWFGIVGSANGFGSFYPPDAQGGPLTTDTTLILTDTTAFKADATQT